MPSTWLRKDWHPREQIDEHLPRTSAFAVYALGTSNGSGGFFVDYVGRTARARGELRRSLRAHEGHFPQCTAFKFDTFADEAAAFASECQIFHTFNPELNEAHPSPPKGSDLECPVPDCAMPRQGDARG